MILCEGSTIEVTLDASSTATAVLTAAANGNTMTGSYTIRAGTIATSQLRLLFRQVL